MVGPALQDRAADACQHPEVPQTMEVPFLSLRPEAGAKAISLDIARVRGNTREMNSVHLDPSVWDVFLRKAPQDENRKSLSSDHIA